MVDLGNGIFVQAEDVLRVEVVDVEQYACRVICRSGRQQWTNLPAHVIARRVDEALSPGPVAQDDATQDDASESIDVDPATVFHDFRAPPEWDPDDWTLSVAFDAAADGHHFGHYNPSGVRLSVGGPPGTYAVTVSYVRGAPRTPVDEFGGKLDDFRWTG